MGAGRPEGDDDGAATDVCRCPQSPPGPDAGDGGGAAADIPAGKFTLPPRVLVVEDEALLALEMESMLLRLGYQVLGPALDLQEALALAKASRRRMPRSWM